MTCPTGNCRRTDEHDAKGCVVAWVMRPVAAPCGRPSCTLSLVDGAVRCQCMEVAGVVVPQPDIGAVHIPTPDRAYFMPPRFKP